MNNYRMNEHAGTHVDAPTHFNKDGWDPSEIPLNRLVNVPAVVVDISGRTMQDPHAQLLPSEFFGVAWPTLDAFILAGKKFHTFLFTRLLTLLILAA